jgi:protein-histidine pros-kinase
MKLLTKLNIVLIVFFGAGGILIAQLAKNFLLNNARDQVVQQAELMMAAAKATREYTNDQLKPLLLKNPDHEINFLPQTVPAFSAITIFSALRKNYSDYTYREATLNPAGHRSRGPGGARRPRRFRRRCGGHLCRRSPVDRRRHSGRVRSSSGRRRSGSTRF